MVVQHGVKDGLNKNVQTCFPQIKMEASTYVAIKTRTYLKFSLILFCCSEGLAMTCQLLSSLWSLSLILCRNLDAWWGIAACLTYGSSVSYCSQEGILLLMRLLMTYRDFHFCLKSMIQLTANWSRSGIIKNLFFDTMHLDYFFFALCKLINACHTLQ